MDNIKNTKIQILEMKTIMSKIKIHWIGLMVDYILPKIWLVNFNKDLVIRLFKMKRKKTYREQQNQIIR